MSPLLLGAMLGAGAFLAFVGARTLADRSLADDRRRRGFWPLNAGLVLAAASMYLFAADG